MAVVPGLVEVLAMVDGDAVKPGARGGVAAKIAEAAERLEENIMRGVLSPLWVAEKSQCEIKNRATVFGVKRGNFIRRPAGGWLANQRGTFGGCVHECFQRRLDNARIGKSRKLVKFFVS
jgi:hypothetical protein